MLHNNILSICETVHLAKQQNLDVDKVLSAFEESLFDSKVWRIFSRAILAEMPDKIAHIKDMMKDLEYVQTTAQRNNSPLHLTQRTAELVRHMMDLGAGYEDVIELKQLYQMPEILIEDG